MRRHLICLTIDTDADRAARARAALEFRGLQALIPLRQALAESEDRIGAGPIPVTWFVRIDGEIERVLGDPLYLVHRHEDFWHQAVDHGDEIGWHPHLYHPAGSIQHPRLETDPAWALDELQRLYDRTRETFFDPAAFRHGEAWHNPDTFATIEALGFRVDSTAIPGRADEPLDWAGAPNQPYFPHPRDIRRPGPDRPLLEIPMTTWSFQASYDKAPKVRYMNPAVHPRYFDAALRWWNGRLERQPPPELSVWVLIGHPDEIHPDAPDDLLYARSPEHARRNIGRFVETLRGHADEIAFRTLSGAAAQWREWQAGTATPG
ncbi:MAG: hypothetical protein R6V58_14870 [Planctomycetota bacterium]